MTKRDVFPVDSVRVGVTEYSVRECDSSEMSLDGRVGEVNPVRAEIRVVTGIPRGVQAQVLVHEIVHAIVDDSGLVFPLPEGEEDSLERSQEEMLVRALSPRVAAFLADNPAAIAAIQRMMGVS